MELLLSRGADPNADSGKALIAAVQSGREDLVQLLLEKRRIPTRRR